MLQLVCIICDSNFESIKQAECCSTKCRNTRYYQANKEKLKQKSIEHYQENKEAILELRKIAYTNDPQKFIDKSAQYYLDNKEQVLDRLAITYANNPEPKRLYNLEYRNINPDAYLSSGRKRRAKLNNVVSENYSRDEVLERDNHLCQFCFKPLVSTAKYPNPLATTIDHIIPLSANGPDVFANVRAAHNICNNKRRTKVNWKPNKELLEELDLLMMGI